MQTGPLKEDLMNLNPSKLRAFPLMKSISEKALEQVSAFFKYLELEEGAVLFKAGETADALYLLEEGEVALKENGDIRLYIHPPAPIGELGAITKLKRQTTAITTQPTKLWRAGRDELNDFFIGNPEVALPFSFNLLTVAANKIQRDQLRLEDMRKNIIQTQKTMKKLRDYLLESQDTPISEPLHDALDALIRQNRRVNYRVSPPGIMPTEVKLNGGEILPVAQISRTHISFMWEEDNPPAVDSTWSGVLRLGGPEIPISGRILRHVENRIDIELDLLIEEYGAIFDGYLARIQLLDILV